MNRRVVKDLTRERKIARRIMRKRKKDTSSLFSSFRHEKIGKFGKLEAT